MARGALYAISMSKLNVGTLEFPAFVDRVHHAVRPLADLRTALWWVNHSSEQVITATSSFLGLDTDIKVDVCNLATFARRLN